MFSGTKRRLYLLPLSILFVGVFSVASQQNITDGTTKPGEKPAEKPAEKKDATKTVMSIEDYSPISIEDPRFTVRNVSFDRRAAGNGNGEFLDVVFDVVNLTSAPVEIYAYVMAFFETDAVDRAGRQLIPYPVWRQNDPARTNYLMHFMTITPKDVPENEIWSETDDDYVNTMRVWDRLRTSLGATEPRGKIYPPYWKVLNYLALNPTSGLKFTLYGDKGPGQNEMTQSNYTPPTPEEKKLRMHKAMDQHKYTLEHNRRQTVFRSHHFSAYRSGFVFFNSVSIIFFDAAGAKKFEDVMKPLNDRRAKLQADRRAMKDRRAAISDEDKPKLDAYAQDDAKLREQEEALRRDASAAGNPLIFKKTYKINRLRNS